MVTSAPYRMDSTPDTGNLAADRDNRYLWRMNRMRLDAESVRDAVLLIAGKLDRTMGGPSVKQFIQSKVLLPPPTRAAGQPARRGLLPKPRRFDRRRHAETHAAEGGAAASRRPARRGAGLGEGALPR